MLTLKVGGEGIIYPTDEFGRLGAIWRVTADQVVENPTEDDITAEDVGWYFDLRTPRLTERTGGPFTTINDAVKAVNEIYDEIAADRAKEMRFDHRRGKRVISIPSGGQPRK
jgi:hypothetical protein